MAGGPSYTTFYAEYPVPATGGSGGSSPPIIILPGGTALSGIYNGTVKVEGNATVAAGGATIYGDLIVQTFLRVEDTVGLEVIGDVYINVQSNSSVISNSPMMFHGDFYTPRLIILNNNTTAFNLNVAGDAHIDEMYVNSPNSLNTVGTTLTVAGDLFTKSGLNQVDVKVNVRLASFFGGNAVTYGLHPLAERMASIVSTAVILKDGNTKIADVTSASVQRSLTQLSLANITGSVVSYGNYTLVYTQLNFAIYLPETEIKVGGDLSQSRYGHIHALKLTVNGDLTSDDKQGNGYGNSTCLIYHTELKVIGQLYNFSIESANPNSLTNNTPDILGPIDVGSFSYDDANVNLSMLSGCYINICGGSVFSITGAANGSPATPLSINGDSKVFELFALNGTSLNQSPVQPVPTNIKIYGDLTLRADPFLTSTRNGSQPGIYLSAVTDYFNAYGDNIADVGTSATTLTVYGSIKTDCAAPGIAIYGYGGVGRANGGNGTVLKIEGGLESEAGAVLQGSAVGVRIIADGAEATDNPGVSGRGGTVSIHTDSTINTISVLGGTARGVSATGGHGGIVELFGPTHVQAIYATGGDAPSNTGGAGGSIRVANVRGASDFNAAGGAALRTGGAGGSIILEGASSETIAGGLGLEANGGDGDFITGGVGGTITLSGSCALGSVTTLGGIGPVTNATEGTLTLFNGNYHIRSIDSSRITASLNSQLTLSLNNFSGNLINGVGVAKAALGAGSQANYIYWHTSNNVWHYVLGTVLP